MTLFVSRKVVVHNLPLPPELPVLHPDQAIIRFGHFGTVDIGAVCFLQREPTPIGRQRRSKEGRKVVLSSFCPMRGDYIRRFISYMSNQVRYSGKASGTLLSDAKRFVVFMAWADANGYGDALDDSNKTKFVAAAYANHIRAQVLSHQLSVNAGATAQQQLFAVLSDYLEIDDLGRGINFLRKDRNTTESTKPPSEAAQGRTLRLCEALFDGLASLVLEQAPYPHGVAVPDYLGYDADTMWVFPSQVWCLPVSKLNIEAQEFAGSGYDYRTGRLTTRVELKALSKYSGQFYKKKTTSNKISGILRNARLALDAANSDPRHWHRQYMGLMAMNAFLPLFLSRTGMNWAQAISLTWCGSYSDSVSTLRQRFRAIKHRANGKVVYFQLPLQFMPIFKRFLQLRAYLLRDSPDFNLLFFSRGNRASGAPTVLKTNLPAIYNMLQRIDPEIVPVLARAWRAGKSDWLLTKTDVATTALVLQNSEQTVRRAYAAGTEASHLSEMSTFLDKLVLDKGAVLDNVTAGAVGKCASFGNPQRLSDAVVPIQPNCRTPEVGCLFCDKFKVHADEVDVRKLLSCRYCLTRTSHLAGFHAMAEPLTRRIDDILKAVSSRDEQLASRIALEVEQGDLDPYWAAKYDMLLRLRLVNDSE